jgi:penicillin amidase
VALPSTHLIAGLAAGQSLAEVAQAAGVSAAEARDLWTSILRRKVPPASASLTGTVSAPVEVIRDSYGVPHVYADQERDLFYGLGFAMAQDRLWQMDYLRRKATGRLAELLGPEYVQQDYLYRLLDFPAVCARNFARLAPRWQQVLEGMAAGVNQAIAQAGDNLPIEFDLLGYRPEPWSPIDHLVGLRYLWWGLSGRLQQITGATAQERALGDRLEEFLRSERSDVYIVPDGQNAAAPGGTPTPPRDTLYPIEQPQGSNNWVIAGSRTKSGRPLIANDPHYSYAHLHGSFYPCHLVGAGHSEVGYCFTGAPGLMTGANDRIAWAYTNNGTTIRDLYAETIDPADPTRYRRGDRWEPLTGRPIEIAVKGQAPVQKTIRVTAHGPIVNDVVPKIGDDDPPLALRWVGFEPIDDVQALLELNTAGSWSEFRAALRNWACSVTNFIYADVDDHIGYQMSARIPLREVATRGIRPAWRPEHEWQGYLPFDANPRIEDPPTGIIATANNRPVNPNYSWPLYGAFAGGTRQTRILEVLSAKADHDLADFRRMQYDSRALIAAEVTPRIVAALRATDDGRLQDAAARLATWDFTAPMAAVAPTIFQAFIQRWPAAYGAAAFPDRPAWRAGAGSAARRALVGAPVGHEPALTPAQLDAAIVATMSAALADLAERFGADPGGWAWGRVHYHAWPHPLGQIGHLGEVLNGPPFPCAGTDNVINNVAPSHHHPFVAESGPVYRFLADLSDPSAVYVNSHCGTSGHPGSPHYADTVRDWAQGNYQALPRLRALLEREAEGTTVIRPA